MDIYDQIGNAEASSELLCAQAMGKSITYQNLANLAVTISATPVASHSETTRFLLGRAQETTLDWIIPAQTNFPPALGIAVDDRLTFEGVTLRVTDWKNLSSNAGIHPGQVTTTRGVYQVTTVWTDERQVGPTSA